MKIKSLFTVGAVVAGLALSSSHALAQANAAGGGGGAGGGGLDFRNPDLANMDPAQLRALFQKAAMDNYRLQLDVQDETEWKVIETRIQKVLDARQEIGFGQFGRGRGQRNGAGPGGGGGGGQFGAAFQAFLKPNPEEEALNQALDSNAPTAQVRAALAKFREARAKKEAALENARTELRKVLSITQEAQAILVGLL